MYKVKGLCSRVSIDNSHPYHACIRNRRKMNELTIVDRTIDNLRYRVSRIVNFRIDLFWTGCYRFILVACLHSVSRRIPPCTILKLKCQPLPSMIWLFISSKMSNFDQSFSVKTIQSQNRQRIYEFMHMLKRSRIFWCI